MNKREQAKLARELCSNLKADMLKAVARIPDAWDGIELRELMADLARNYSAFQRLNTPDFKKRLRDYRNTRATVSGL